MASTLLFVAMTILAALILFVASLTSTVGANNAFQSSFYNVDSRVRSAYQCLTVAAALGWSSLVVLIILVIVAAFAGGFSTVDISDSFLLNPSPSTYDLTSARVAEQELASGYTTQIIILIIYILIAIVALIIGILGTVAAVQLNGTKQKDSFSNSAYVSAFITAVCGYGAAFILCIAIIAYIYIRAERANRLLKLEAFNKRVTQTSMIIPDTAIVLV